MPAPARVDLREGAPAPVVQEEAMTGRTELAGWVALALLTGVGTVWAWQFGGWFGTAFYPGAVVLAIGLILLALFAPSRARFRGWPALALGGLIALGAWAALSGLWSPAPEVAIEDAQRILTYAVAFGMGLWICDLLGARGYLAMAPLACAGLVAGALAVTKMLDPGDLGQVLDNGTLQYPIGYRNANAAFFAIAIWPAVGLASTRELDWRLRAVSLGVATLCMQLAVLSQSRASIIAGGAALIVYVLASRDRARAVIWLALAVGPALIVLPALTDLYSAATELGRAATLSELDSAGRAVLLGTSVAIALGAIAALLGRRFPASTKTLRLANRAVALGAAGAVVAGAVCFVIATGDPVEWIGERANEFQTRGTPHEANRSSRFAFNGGTERDDLWRVALDDVEQDPFQGTGAGGYYYSYLRGRSPDGIQSARDAHSVEMEVLGELGIPGLVLLVLALAGAAGGALRSRRTGPRATALSACALTAGAYWLTHASVDWHWPFPALSAAVLALLGAAGLPSIIRARSTRRGRGRWLMAAAAATLAITVVPPYLSERYVSQAFDTWRIDPQRAYEDLDRARALNPLDEDPLLAEGAIAWSAGDRARAIEAFQQVVRERPQEWVSHYFLARLYRAHDPARARRSLESAAERNPHSRRLEDALARHRPEQN